MSNLKISKVRIKTYSNNTRAQLDHILINKKWENSTLNSIQYS